ncbi:MAG: zinc ABC transporter substrate-binding protein [Nitrospirae bacterium]|nr:zinc ABC transporter substrate-binding protein [Nitrospirota bacterium]
MRRKCLIRPVALLFAAIALMVGYGTPVCAAGQSAESEPIEVVVTLPVLKDLAEHVGGPRVRVMSLMSGLESEHSYSPRPSDLVAVRKARVLFEVGLGLEVWVSSLVKNSGNSGLLVVTTSKGIALIRDHESASEAGPVPQDDHRAGNPHVWLDPENAKVMMRHITEALIKVDPAHAVDYRNNQAAYLRQLDQLQTELIERLRNVPDRRIVVHHPAWPYFARRFGLEVVGEIVRQAGAEPSAHHMQELIMAIRKNGVRVIASEPQLNQKIPEVLARETGARVVVLTPLPGGVAGTDTYLDMLRYNVTRLAEALEAAKPN